MEIRFTQSGKKWAGVFSALFLAALICNVFATLDWLHLLPAALIGAVLPLLPQTRQRKVQYVLWGVLAVWLLLRFSSLLNGGKLLANRMFALSEQSQSYEYDYFSVSGNSAVEAVLWLSMLTGTLCALLGSKVNGILWGVWMLAMVYFGVTPGILWLAVLAWTAFLNVLPGQHRWFYGLITGILVAGIALAAIQITPEPSQAVSALDDRLRDTLAVQAVSREQTPVPTEVPEPEIVPQPETERKQPDHGVQKAVLNILFLALAALTLALLFVPAIIKDRAEKKRGNARLGLDDPDHSAAIRAMYLYMLRWRTMADTDVEIPTEVYAIWQEAAFSDHTMKEAQRETIHAYMKETAERVWKEADWKKRLIIRYRICL